MDNKGYSTIETALVFPLFMLLTALLFLLLVSFVLEDRTGGNDSETFIHRVYMTDSIKRKAALISDVFE